MEVAVAAAAFLALIWGWLILPAAAKTELHAVEHVSLSKENAA